MASSDLILLRLFSLVVWTRRLFFFMFRRKSPSSNQWARGTVALPFLWSKMANDTMTFNMTPLGTTIFGSTTLCITTLWRMRCIRHRLCHFAEANGKCIPRRRMRRICHFAEAKWKMVLTILFIYTPFTVMAFKQNSILTEFKRSHIESDQLSKSSSVLK